MPRRTLITASILLLILALLAFLPALPAARDYALKRLGDALAGSDITLDYRASSGNLWRGVTLEDATIDGAGSSVTVERLRVGYFLPSLLGGELPLDIAVAGADGHLDLDSLLDEVAAPSGATQSGSISLRLRRLDLRDIGVDIAQLPFTLPDTSLDQLDVVQDGTNLNLDGRLVTPDGEASVSARYESLTGTAFIEVINADATIARHWWDGISAGRVRGELEVRGSSIEGDFVISDAEVDDIGLHAENVSGTASLRYPVISAELRGTALDGPLRATGVVNVVARRWEASGTATPTLSAAADWLARSQYPNGLPLAIDGEADVNLTVAGWESITLNGDARGAGAVLGVPLEGLAATFRLPADGEVRADATGTLGGGPIEFSMGPSAGAERLSVNATEVSLAAIQEDLGVLDAALNLTLGSGSSGTLQAHLLSAATGTPTRVDLDATLDPDGWQGFISAEDNAGLTAEGALVLDGGRLQGSLTSDETGRDLFTPGARVVVAVDGDLSSGGTGLNVTLGLNQADSTSPNAAGPVTLNMLPPLLAESLDLRGSVTGVLDLSSQTGPAVRELGGAFGPVAVSGTVALSPLRAEMGLSSSPLTLATADAAGDGDSAGLATTLSIPNSTLTLDSTGVSWNGAIEHDGVTVGPLDVEPGTLDALFALPSGGPWDLTANTRRGDLVLTADPSGFRADLNSLPVHYGGDPLALLSGTVGSEQPGATATTPAEPTDSAAATGGLTTTPIALALTLEPAAGAVGAAPLLPVGASLQGSVNLAGGRADLSGQLDTPRPLPLTSVVRWGDGAQGDPASGTAPGLTAELTLPSSDPSDPLRATYIGGTGAFTIAGRAALSAVTDVADGTLTSGLSGTLTATGLTDLEGELNIDLTEPTPVVADLTGADSVLELSVTAGQPAAGADTAPLLTAAGTIDVSSFAALANAEGPLLVADIGPFDDIGVGLSGASGSGTLEAMGLGPAGVPELPWDLVAAWGEEAPPSLTLSLNNEPLSLTLSDNALAVDGNLSLPLLYSGQEFVLNATVPGGRLDPADLAATPLAGTLTEAESGEVATFDGTLGDLNVEADLPLALLIPTAPLAARPQGRLALTADVAPLAGPDFSAALELTAELPPEARTALPGETGAGLEPVTLSGTASGSGSDITAELSGSGLDFVLRDRLLSLTADATELRPLIGVAGTLDGTLRFDATSGWSGALNVTASLDVGDGAEPVTAGVELIGAGSSLRADALVTGPLETRLAAAGTIAPTFDLSGTIDAAGGTLSGSLNYEAEAGLIADLNSRHLTFDDYLELPAMAARLSLAPGEPLRLQSGGVASVDTESTADGAGVAPGPFIDISAELGGTLAGNARIPLRLLDQPAGLTIELGGSLTQPSAVAAISGEGLELAAEGDLESAHAELQIDPAVAAELAPAAATVTDLVDGPVRAQATWTASEGWSLNAFAALLAGSRTTTADSTATDQAEQGEQSDQDPRGTGPLGLVLSLSGAADTYAGELSAYPPGAIEQVPNANNGSPSSTPLAVAEISGVGGDLNAELDLGAVAWRQVGELLGVDLDLTGSGRLGFATAPVRTDLSVDLSGELEGLQVAITGDAAEDLDLRVSSADVDLNARLAWNQPQRAVIQGTVRGQPVEGSLNLADDLRSGDLSLQAPGVQLQATLSTDEGPEAASNEAQTPQAVRTIDLTSSLDGAGLSGDVTAQLTLIGSRADLTSLEAAFSGVPGAETLALSAYGPLTPRIDVTGTLDAPTLDQRATVHVGHPTAEAALHAELVWQELRLAYTPTDAQASLRGRADLSGILAPYLGDALDQTLVGIDQADLAWTADRGFDGSLEIDIDSPLLSEYGLSSPLTVVAEGRAAPDTAPSAEATAPTEPAQATPLLLSLTTRATPPDLAGTVVTAEATAILSGPLTNPTELTLDGELLVDADISAQDQVLSARAELSGSLSEPELDGTLTANGPVAGAGTIAYAAGRGSLDLTGPHLSLAAELSGGQWSATGSLDRLPIGEWVPQLSDPLLSLNASAASPTTGTELEATIDGLLIESSNSRLSGGATISGGVRVALQAQMDLADLRLDGTSLTGLLRGPLVLTAPTLGELENANVTAQLDAAQVGLAAVDATVSGSLILGGRVSAPTLGALLNGNGDLSGALRVNATPSRGQFELTSSLAGPGFSTDLQIGVSEETVLASGQARYQDAVILLDEGPQGITLSGAGRLDGWQAVIAADLSAASASGPLAAVSSAVSGELELQIVNERAQTVDESDAVSTEETAAEPWLQARLSDVAVAGATLGDLSLSSTNPGDDLLLSGEGITASVAPGDLAWHLDVARVDLPAGFQLAATGSGQGAAGSLSGSLVSAEDQATNTADPAPLGVDIDFDLASDPGAAHPLELNLTGSALGGALGASGARAAGGAWSGDVRLAGAEVAGVALSVTGVLQGQSLVPQAVLATAAYSASGTPLSVAGRVSLGGSGVTFDQTAALGPLPSPLRLQGRLSPQFDVTLSAAPGAGRADEGEPVEPAASGSTRLYATGEGLRAAGEFVMPWGPIEVLVGGSGAQAVPRVTVRLAAVENLSVEADLAADSLGDLVATVGSDGLTFVGSGAAHGSVALGLSPNLAARLDGFGANLAGFSLALTGELAADSAELGGVLRLPLELPVGSRAAGSELPLRVVAADGHWTVESSGELGELSAEFAQADSSVLVDLDLALPAGSSAPAEGLDQGLSSGAVVGRITYDPLNGPAGTLALADVSLAPNGIGPLTLNADTAIADGRLGGSATLDTAGGRVTMNGATRLSELFPGLPGSAAGGAEVTTLEVRVRTLRLEEFPAVRSLAPHLSGALSGVVQLRNGFLLGQFVAPELEIGGERVPLELQLSGLPSDLDAAMQFAGSLFTADLGRGRIAGSSRLERFPIDLLGEAFVGPTDVEAFMTGVVRFDLPNTDPTSGYVRLATEEITLERAGVMTRGQVALSYEDRHLDVQRAEFGGEGTWTAHGVLGPELLDFTLEANEADFSPLLGLVPALSRFAVGAAGSFTFSAQGDFSDPQISLSTDNLDVTAAGNRLRIENTDIELAGTELNASTTLRGLEPLEGAVSVTGGASVMLAPLALRNVDFALSGDVDVPGIGLVSELSGSIRQNAENLPTLFLTGLLGAPLTIEGTLVPLDLRASGTDLEVAFPTLLIADSTLAADLTLTSEVGGVVIGGAIEATEVLIDPAARQAAAEAAEADTPAPEGEATPEETPAPAPSDGNQRATPGANEVELAADAEVPPIAPASEQLPAVEGSALADTPTVAEAEAQGALNARAAVRFDDVRITAPQRVLLSMSIASLEAAVDLTLSGTAAEPLLSGDANALRGSLRFAGREFTVDRAVATFTPGRGVLPELDVAARTEFEKSRVLAGAPDVEFVAPSDGNTFAVDLTFAGPMELDEESGGMRFDIVPVLTSDALVEISGEGVGSGVRPLSEAELLSLITLGRIEFGSDLIGAGGLGGAVAQGALDTAVDLLVVGELQNALREALGLDVVEIRTTAFSSLLGGEGAQPFGVSVRVGGYLNPELFASYRIGTTDPNDPGYGFTNEVALRYGLGPLNLDLLGRLDFPVAGTFDDPRPELGVGVSYDFGRALSIDTGVTLSTERSTVSFGVALRW